MLFSAYLQPFLKHLSNTISNKLVPKPSETFRGHCCNQRCADLRLVGRNSFPIPSNAIHVNQIQIDRDSKPCYSQVEKINRDSKP